MPAGRIWMLVGVLLCGLSQAAGAEESPVTADWLLRGGTIYDGTGAEAKTGDVALRNGQIVAVGRFSLAQVTRVVDCTGLVIAPGFIDLHTHCDPVGTPEVRRNRNYLTQGCTTVVTGNCGSGPIDVAAYLARIDREGAGTNVIVLIGHGSLRQTIMGGGNRTPNADELQRMREKLEQGLREGAWGMSSGLIYTPGMFAKTDELIELSKVVARYQGFYATHLRNEASQLLPSVREALTIGRAAGLPVHLSHLKAVGPINWGAVRQAAALVEEARAAGQTVTADQYPYVATSTHLTAVLFPATEIPGGLKDFARRMETDAQYLQAVRHVVGQRLKDNPRIVIAECRKHPEWIGKSLDQIASERNTDLVDAACHVRAEEDVSIVRFVLSEDDVRYGMTLPWVATASDGFTLLPTPNRRPHPRSFGTFPRKIGRYAQREKTLSVVQAIRSATGLPADILRLSDRGYLRPGCVADVVVFDPATFIDRATFEDPQQYSPGVRWLWLAGQAAIADGQPAEPLYGRGLRHPIDSSVHTP